MITKFPKTPSTNNYRKPNTNTGKARAAQVPKGSASAKSSFFLNSQASTSSLAHSAKRGGFMSSQGNHPVPMDNSASGSSTLKGTKSQQNPGGRFASPKVSASGFGLSKTATIQHEKRNPNMSTKEFINNLYSPYAKDANSKTAGRAVEQ